MANKKTSASNREEKQRAALEAKVRGWRTDLVSGTARKREAAARRLAEVEPRETRATLLAELDAARTKAAKNTVAVCLHWVADLEIARRLMLEDKVDLHPGRLPVSLLATLYDDLRADLPSASAGSTKRRLEKLGVLDSRPNHGQLDHPQRWASARRELVFAVLAQAKLRSTHEKAGQAIRDLDDSSAWSQLVALWHQQPGVVRAFDAFVACLRLDDDSEPSPALVAAVIDEVGRNVTFAVDLEEEADGYDYDDYGRGHHPSRATATWMQAESFDPARLDERVERIAADQLSGLVTALATSNPWPALTDAIARRIVSRANQTDALTAILDDQQLSACHDHAAIRLANTGEARRVIERARRVRLGVLASVLKTLHPSEAFDLLQPVVVREERDASPIGSALSSVPSALRDLRWLDAARELPGEGRDLLIAMARDPQNPGRTKAVDQLAAAVARAAGWVEKRQAVFALGQTGHPHATLYLVDALDDPELADGAPLICTALSEVGDTRAIPMLEKRKRGPHASFITHAIEHIRARVTQIHAEVLLAAVQDDDPMIADLARRAQDGDHDSAIVLEDALRERGRL